MHEKKARGLQRLTGDRCLRALTIVAQRHDEATWRGCARIVLVEREATVVTQPNDVALLREQIDELGLAVDQHSPWRRNALICVPAAEIDRLQVTVQRADREIVPPPPGDLKEPERMTSAQGDDIAVLQDS